MSVTQNVIAWPEPTCSHGPLMGSGFFSSICSTWAPRGTFCPSHEGADGAGESREWRSLFLSLNFGLGREGTNVQLLRASNTTHVLEAMCLLRYLYNTFVNVKDRQTGFPKEILLKSYREAEEKQELLFQNICENILFKNVLQQIIHLRLLDAFV